MEYNFRKIEKKWQQKWQEDDVYKVNNDSSKPKYYVLDMFPYPSGAGLHVGHPLGYIASDIYARYKRLKGFNVLHPMGYDAFGLPAEQYAIDHGVHPAISTEQNINTFRKQLENIGFSYDWSREVRTSDPKYYKWTQWIFLQLFDSWYNRLNEKAERIRLLVEIFEKEGNSNHPIPNSQFQISDLVQKNFSAEEWKSFDESTQQTILMEYRLAYCGYGEVNWCEALGTVLANDEVVNGVSERGGFPVVKKKLRQWYLRITEYADRLLEGLDQVEFTESLKEQQKNWIGRSEGAEIEFRLTPHPSPRGEGGKTLSGNYFKTADTHYWHVLKQYAKDNRKNSTEAEDILWQRIRNNQLGVKVRRQHSIEGYIVDFAILEVRLAIEIDGGYHSQQEQQLFDEARTKYLNEHNLHIIRFTNEEVIQETEKVIDKIRSEIKRLRSNNQGAASLPLLREEKGSGDEAEKTSELALKVYTTRPDTIFGVDFMVLAPEHELVEQITTSGQKQAVEEYINYVKSRNERERIAEKQITGVFTGAYAIHPFSGKAIPIWISEYVLAGYGTGAIMAVPCGDERDHKFAKHFNIPITNIIGHHYNGEEANPTKDAVLQNSDFLDGLVMRDAIEVVNKKIEELGIGVRKINYKMRDAAFSRQRYWGEPFPIIWKDNMAYPLPENELPVVLPHIDEIKPGPEGEGPLANLEGWVNVTTPSGEKARRETNTMPGYAGSSWYFLRYMDPHNDNQFCSRKASDYWGQVDLYIGGTEHAVGHLLYSRMWTKALYDLGYIGHDEPYKKLVNQGKIGGVSQLVYRYNVSQDGGSKSNHIPYPAIQLHSHKLYTIYYSADFIIPERPSEFVPIHVPIDCVDEHSLNVEKLVTHYRSKYEDSVFVCKDGYYVDGKWYELKPQRIATTPKRFVTVAVIEKMSKRYFNVVNPDDIIFNYGADTFRMYEMFLGPVEQDKPWDTKGIEGVHRFLKKLWRLYVHETKGLIVTDEPATEAELKVLHKSIKKIEEDTERFSFNTAVSSFMILVNELMDLKCHKKEILGPLLSLIAPYAPHIAEELWDLLKVSPTGGDLEGASILNASYPQAQERYLIESSKNYPIAVNGKTRTELNIALDATQQQVEEIILQNEVIKRWLEGKAPKKVIYVKGKMVNVVV